MHDKAKALELLAKYQGMLVDRVQHEGTILIEVADRLRSAVQRVTVDVPALPEKTEGEM
jgi:hypothetical protein